MTRTKAQQIQADWWSKTLAGVILGFTLALALTGIFAWVGPGGIDAPQKVQVVMWMIAPLWMILCSTSYFFRTGLSAWLWLLLANLIAYTLLFIVRHP